MGDGERVHAVLTKTPVPEREPHHRRQGEEGNVESTRVEFLCSSGAGMVERPVRRDRRTPLGLLGFVPDALLPRELRDASGELVKVKRRDVQFY